MTPQERVLRRIAVIMMSMTKGHDWTVSICRPHHVTMIEDLPDQALVAVMAVWGEEK